MVVKVAIMTFDQNCRLLTDALVVAWNSDFFFSGWLCGTVVERRCLTGELSLSYARPAADG